MNNHIRGIGAVCHTKKCDDNDVFTYKWGMDEYIHTSNDCYCGISRLLLIIDRRYSTDISGTTNSTVCRACFLG